MCRQESSEDEYEEDATTAKKLGMMTNNKKPVVDDKKPSGIQVINFKFDVRKPMHVRSSRSVLGL
jgi:hypothetical protein